MAHNLPRLLSGNESGFMSLSMQGLDDPASSAKPAKRSDGSGTNAPVAAPTKVIGKGPPTALGAALSRLLNRGKSSPDQDD
jgi:hypothetical protein